MASLAVMAQVYSVNVVGYIQVTCNPGYTLVANQLVTENNTVPELFAGVPGGTTVYKFDSVNTKFLVNQYDAEFEEWGDMSMTVDPGEGVFVLNPTQEPIVITFVGEVLQGDLEVPLAAGYSIVSSKVPQAGLLETDLGYVPAGGDTVYKFDNANTKYLVHQYDAEFAEWDVQPALAVGEAVFLLKSEAGTWNRTFQVN
jgi:hypothetical protein